MRERLICGKLLKARGLIGEIGVQPYADDPSRFYKIRQCRAETEDGETIKELVVKHVNVAGNKVFLRFEGYDSRDTVSALTGYYLSIPRSEAVPLDQDSWYVCDLISCRVEDEKRGFVGVVEDVIQNNAQDVLKVCSEGEKPLYIPLLKRALISVDPAQKLIRLRLQDGLYEIYRES